MSITYSAIIEASDGSRKVWRRSANYDKLAADFQAMRLRHSHKNDRWLGGYITSEAVNF